MRQLQGLDGSWWEAAQGGVAAGQLPDVEVPEAVGAFGSLVEEVDGQDLVEGGKRVRTGKAEQSGGGVNHCKCGPVSAGADASGLVEHAFCMPADLAR